MISNVEAYIDIDCVNVSEYVSVMVFDNVSSFKNEPVNVYDAVNAFENV